MPEVEEFFASPRMRSCKQGTLRKYAFTLATWLGFLDAIECCWYGAGSDQSDIARHLELHTSTVSRHIKTWTQVQQNIASQRSTVTPSAGDRAHAAEHGHDENTDDIDAGSDYGVDNDYAQVSIDRDYVGGTLTQQRAVRTRADLLAGAATEFVRIRLCSIIGHPHSRQHRVQQGVVYTAIAERWTAAEGIDPLDAITGMVDDAAQAFIDDVSLRAEARLSLEPEFSAHRPTTAWDAALLVVARRAAESGWMREGFTAENFVRVLAAPLAGHRLLEHIVPAGVAMLIRSGYTESLETVIAAATTTKADADAHVG